MGEEKSASVGLKMGEEKSASVTKLFHSLGSFMQSIVLRVLSVGPIPNHIAFIMDGNRRYAKKKNLEEGAGHKAGFTSLMSMLKYCYELGVKYATVYAFSIDNFKRKPEEVQTVMDLMQEKIEGLLKEESIVNQYGIRVYFIGNLNLLNEPVRVAAENAMRATAKNTKCALLICVAYTSTDEIVHAVQESCLDKWEAKASNGVENDKKGEIQEVNGVEREEKLEEHRAIQLVDIEKHLYMSVAPDPDILIRTSGGDPSEQFSSMAELKHPVVLSKSIVARDWFVAFGVGRCEFSEELLIFGEKKEATVTVQHLPFQVIESLSLARVIYLFFGQDTSALAKLWGLHHLCTSSLSKSQLVCFLS